MRLRLSSAILIGLLLIIGWSNQAWAASTAAATPRPTPTYKACHVCDEEDVALSTRLNSTPSPTAGQSDQQDKAASATATPLTALAVGAIESPAVASTAVVQDRKSVA